MMTIEKLNNIVRDFCYKSGVSLSPGNSEGNEAVFRLETSGRKSVHRKIWGRVLSLMVVVDLGLVLELNLSTFPR